MYHDCELFSWCKIQSNGLSDLKMQLAASLLLQELGRQNQDMLGNLYSSFMAHIEKVTQSLDKLMAEHRTLSHFLDHQTLDFSKLKKGVCEMGKGTHPRVVK